MKIASWNINGIKARLDNVLAWLGDAEPDLACLQEIKSVDEAFPTAPFEDLGYNLAVHGQKGFNGVAILSKLPIEDVTVGLPGDAADTQARFVEVLVSAEWGPLRVANLYLPNGNPVDSEKYPYKLAWMERLIALARQRLDLEEPTIFAGDYNVIPAPGDVHDPAAWQGDALYRPESWDAFRALERLGYTDAVRATSDEAGLYTFWDFQGGAWQKNHGIRIDHLMLSPQAADCLAAAWIDKRVRAWEKPSDHVPVLVELAG